MQQNYDVIYLCKTLLELQKNGANIFPQVIRNNKIIMDDELLEEVCEVCDNNPCTCEEDELLPPAESNVLDDLDEIVDDLS